MKITEFNQNQKKELLDYLSKFKDIKDQDVEISINLISNCIDKHTDSIQEAVDVECIIKGKKCIVKHIKEYKKACIAIPIDEKEDFSNFIEFLSKYDIFLWGVCNKREDNNEIDCGDYVEDYFYKRRIDIIESEIPEKAIYNQKIAKKIDQLHKQNSNIKDDTKMKENTNEIIKLMNQARKNYFEENILKCDIPITYYINQAEGEHQSEEIIGWIDKVTPKEKQELEDYFENVLNSDYMECEEFDFPGGDILTWLPGDVSSLRIIINGPLTEEIIFNNEESV